MDSLYPEKPFPGFPDPLLQGAGGQHPAASKNNDIFRPAKILRKAGGIFFTFCPGTLSFHPGNYPDMNSEYVQEYIFPGPVI
jgi:hypothetical protein